MTRADVLARLNVSEEDLVTAPRISHLFRRAGGIRAILDALDGSDDPDARQIMARIREPGMVRSHGMEGPEELEAPFEAFCLAAQVAPLKALGLIVSALAEQSQQEAVLVAASRAPEVVDASIKYALEPDGEADRKMLFQHSRFLPMPKNSVTQFFGRTSISASQTNVEVSVLPPVEDSVRRMSDRFNEKMLGAPPPSPEVIDVEADEDE